MFSAKQFRLSLSKLTRRFSNKSGDISDKERWIAKAEVERFMVDCMIRMKVPINRAEMLAQNLSEADARGHFSHGLNRLAVYVSDIENDLCDPTANPKVLKETVSTAWIDGCKTLGVVVGHFSMNLAIKKAKETGIGWVSAKGSNHFGICQWYTAMATKENLIGMASTNTSPHVVPTRSQAKTFGTNPIAIAANGQREGDGFVLDMSTSSVAVGKLEIQSRKGEDLPSKGWALGSDGHPTVNAHEALNSGKGLMPLGGEEINSGYKGYGLGMLVDILCGVLSGSKYGPHIRNLKDHSQVANLGHFFVAIDPDCFAPGFSSRLQDLMDHLRQLTPTDSHKPILVPGDPERQALATMAAKNGAIFYTKSHILTYRQLAEKLNVKPLQHQSH